MKTKAIKQQIMGFGFIFYTVLFSFSTAHAGPMYVFGKHETGWQETTYTFNSLFSGYAVFGVSNVNSTNNSKLVLDNISGSGANIFFPNGTSNLGFEDGDFSGFSSSDNDGDSDDGSISLVDSDTNNGTFDATFNDARDVSNNYIGTINVTPHTGTYAAFLDSFGANTSGFKNENGLSGTTGSYIYVELDAESDDSITFNWNFFSDESFQLPLDEGDFAFFRLVDRNDPLTTSTPIHHETLAQVSAVPLPASIFLLVPALGLLGFKRKQ